MNKIIFITIILLLADNAYAECTINKILESNSNYFPRNAETYGNLIVFENHNDLIGYDLGLDLRFNTSDDKGFFNITANGINVEPDLYENYISWVSFNPSSEIYLCNFFNNGNYGGCLWNDTKIKVTDYLSLKRRPFLIRDVLLWEDNVYGNFDIFMCNINFGCINKKPARITNNSFNQINVHSDGNIIVWEDHRNGNADLYMYNLNDKKEYPLIVDIDNQRKPKITYKSFILWDSNKNVSDDVYFKSIGNDLIPYTGDDSWEFILAGTEFDEFNVKISKEKEPKLAVWETSRFNNIGIGGFDILNNSFFDINVTGIDLVNPSVYGNNIIFEGLGNQKKYLFIAKC